MAVACRFAQARKGSIVIDVPDQTSVRMVTNYIEAMLADQEQLSRLTATWHDGEVTMPEEGAVSPARHVTSTSGCVGSHRDEGW